MFENPAITLAIKMASPILVGFVTPFAVDAVKRSVALVDKAPTYAKQGLAIAIAPSAPPSPLSSAWMSPLISRHGTAKS